MKATVALLMLAAVSARAQTPLQQRIRDIAADAHRAIAVACA
jgi:hypothetical protein